MEPKKLVKASIDDVLKGEKLTKKQLTEAGMVYQNSLADLDIYKHKDFFYVMCPYYAGIAVGFNISMPEEKKKYILHLSYKGT
jgi:hypothetical protein